MTILIFTLNPGAVGQLHDLLTCLAKFNEDVSLEATQSELRISSLNVSKTAYASFRLSGNTFFDKYHFSPGPRASSTKAWACKLQSRALASVFKRRVLDSRDKDASLQRCEFELQARNDLPENRLVIRLICGYGIQKTFRLTYEGGEILQVSFDKTTSVNSWTLSSKTLRDVVEYFGPKTEHLDWYLNNGKVTFTSYTERIQYGKEILKQPMHTSVALEQGDFGNCTIEENIHICINVKDFRAIVAHAETAQASVNALYSRGNQPMQINYDVGGLRAEFTLMTRSSSSVAASTGTPAGSSARDLSLKSTLPAHQRIHPASTSLPAPTATQRSRAEEAIPAHARSPSEQTRSFAPNGSLRPSAPISQARINEGSLFIPADDGDEQWDAPNYDEEQAYVTWEQDSNTVQASTSMRRIRDSETISYGSDSGMRSLKDSAIPPTQRLSQVKGLFD